MKVEICRLGRKDRGKRENIVHIRRFPVSLRTESSLKRFFKSRVKSKETIQEKEGASCVEGTAPGEYSLPTKPGNEQSYKHLTIVTICQGLLCYLKQEDSGQNSSFYSVFTVKPPKEFHYAD